MLAYQEFLKDQDCKFAKECENTHLEFCGCYQDYLLEALGFDEEESAIEYSDYHCTDLF